MTAARPVRVRGQSAQSHVTHVQPACHAAPSQAARRLVAAWHHSHCLLEEPVFPSTRPPVVMVALIERRIWTPLDYRRDRHHAGTHSDALRTAAQAVSAPKLSQRWPARRFANVKVQTATGPTRLRDRQTALCKCVRSYERTYMPAWQPQPTNWCHGSPAGHLHGAYRPPWPHGEK